MHKPSPGYINFVLQVLLWAPYLCVGIVSASLHREIKHPATLVLFGVSLFGALGLLAMCVWAIVRGDKWVILGSVASLFLFLMLSPLGS